MTEEIESALLDIKARLVQLENDNCVLRGEIEELKRRHDK